MSPVNPVFIIHINSKTYIVIVNATLFVCGLIVMIIKLVLSDFSKSMDSLSEVGQFTLPEYTSREHKEGEPQ